ncbi:MULTISPECIES: hypothetical protein [Prochlorococcus]|nr:MULTISPECIES: hypothetical protein [Prochlorococcus]
MAVQKSKDAQPCRQFDALYKRHGNHALHHPLFHRPIETLFVDR